MKTQELQEMWNTMTQEERDLELALCGIERTQIEINSFKRDYDNCASDEARGSVMDRYNMNWKILEQDYAIIARSVL